VSLRAATPELIAQRVCAVLDKRPDAEVIALRAEPRWMNGPLPISGRHVVVKPCTSPLAVRAALADWADEHTAGAANGSAANRSDLLVVLCDLADADLGADVLARFTPAQVLGLEPWNAVKSLFGVLHLDAAFNTDDGWIADALLAHVPGDVARARTRGAVLTVEVALDTLADQLLGAERLDVDAVLPAAARPNPFASLDAAAPATRTGMLDDLGERNGALGALVAAVIRVGEASDLLPLGLVARAVYGHGEHDGGRAAGHLEARCGGVRIAPAVGTAFAQRCEEVVTALFASDPDRANVIVAKAATLATDIDASHPEYSDVLPSGFDRRVAIAAGLIATVLDGLADDASTPAPREVLRAADALADRVDRVGHHRQSQTPGGRTRHDHLEMAARLTTWLATPHLATPPTSFEEAATAYAESSAWIDRARRRLWHGDGDPGVGATYRRVLDAVVTRRRVENERFAKLLAAWTDTPSNREARTHAGVIAVEDVATEILAPLGTATPLLFVVLDGCGVASFTELAPQLSETGYREVIRSPPTSAGGPATGRRLIGIAALPTVTEVSRASLISGHLDHGDQDHERRAFAANSSLAIGGTPAAFFHQNKLFGPAGSSLSAAVDRAVSASELAVVGVAINVIDDHLKRGTFTDELRLQDLHALVPLLDAARTHGRAIVFSADHGHVLAQPDDGGTGAFQGGGTGGERWRTADRPAGDNEVLLRGERVLLGGEAGVLAPFDDDFRYGAKAGGYHGGATPEEVLVPVAVFIPAGIDPPAGWEHRSQVPPLWWDLRIAGASEGDAVTVAGPSVTAGEKPRRKAKPVDRSQVAMFDVPPAAASSPGPSPAVTPAAGAGEPRWIALLLATDIWTLQKGASSRAQLPEDRVRRVLAAVDRRGGVISFAALAADSATPIGRLPGFLAHLARVLNVDGYPVLDVDATAAEVRLSVQLLTKQFEIAVDRA